MRAIAQEFHLSAWQVQQTLTVYMFAYAVAVAVSRLAVRCAGTAPARSSSSLGIYTLASIGCAAAPNFATLLAFRAVQGLVAGGGQIIGRAIVRDQLPWRRGAAPHEPDHDDLRPGPSRGTHHRRLGACAAGLARGVRHHGAARLYDADLHRAATAGDAPARAAHAAARRAAG